MTDVDDAIETNAQGPAEARGDQGSMRQHGLKDQIAASRFLAENDALNDTAKPTLGIRLAILKPPGAV